MKVLIISVNREKFPDPVFPLGASYIAAATRKAGHEVFIYDACFSDNPVDEIKKSVKDNNPDVIGISIRNVDNNAFPIAESYLNYYKDVVSVIREISKAKIVLGGSGYSIFPDLYYDELKPDFAVKGEGEFAFIELLKNIGEGKNITEKIIYPKSIKDLNFQEYPLREGFDIDKYFLYSGCINIQTKRGCPFQCTYCTYPVLEGCEYRYRTPETVVDEIEYWKKTKNINYVFFVDNVFNHPEEYAKNICKEIIKRNLKIKWTGFFIPKFYSKDFLDICIESGLTSCDFGTDAFSDATLKGFKKSFTKEDIFEACQMCKDKGIKFNHSLIFGGPGETLETLEETIANVDKTAPNAVIGFIGVRLYAGTEILNEVKDVKVGINPVFYVSDKINGDITEYLREKLKGRHTWIIPGLEKGTDLKLIARIRERGVKGPLWEIISNMRV